MKSSFTLFLLLFMSVVLGGCTNVSSVRLQNPREPYGAGEVGVGPKIGRVNVVNGIDFWEGGLPNRPYSCSGVAVASFGREGFGAINYEPKRDLQYIAKFAAENKADGVLIIGEHVSGPAVPGTEPKKCESLIRLIKYL